VNTARSCAEATAVRRNNNPSLRKG
jgi:hypothetical protein